MKTSGVVCLVLGILLILINIIADLSDPQIFIINDGKKLGYFIGFHLFLVVGLILLIIPYRQSGKSRKTKLSELEESIQNIGK